MEINFKKNYKFWLILLVSIIVILLMNYYELNLEGFQGIGYLAISISMLIIILLISTIAIFIYYHKKLTIEKLFWFIIPTIYIMFMLVMPAFKSHDEPFQWFRMQAICNGQILAQVSMNQPVAEIRKDIFDATSLHPENINYSYIIEKLTNDTSNKEDIAKALIPTTAVYSPIQYLPQMLGITIGKTIFDNAMFMAYAGRIVNMLVSILILYMAFKKMPFGKIGLLVSMCLPIAVEDFTSLSADALTISICYLFIAYVLSIVFSEARQINKKDIAVLLVSSVILALCKIVYLPIVGLVLLLTRDKFKTRKTQIISIVGILTIATIFNLLWLKIANTYLELYENGRSTTQLAILLQNPFGYLQRVIYTIAMCIFDYTNSLFGIELGWNEFARMNYLLPLSMLTLFIFVNICDNTLKVKLTKYQNIIICLIVLAVIGLIFTSLYIQWNDPENIVITGIQGRYFIPIIPLIITLVFSKIKLKVDIKEEWLYKITGITICILYIYVLTKLFILNI